MIQTQSYSIHRQKPKLYSQINTRALTLVGSVGPCHTNKVALKETYRREDLITHINSMNYNLYHYFRNGGTINSLQESILHHNNA
jgi:hypothetical protein